jgi:hypothetical protein
MFKNFQKYLLENKPIYYQSKFWEMMALSVFFWLISFLIGFVSIDIQVLQHSSINRMYFGSFAVVHSIAVVIVYVVWALSFFKTNAIQHFYPISKYYHHKLFIQIVVPAIFLVAVYYPYTYGLMLRTKSILNKSELVNDANTVNKAYPFLVENRLQYNLEERVFPNQFLSINIIAKNEDNEWPKQYIYDKLKYTDNHIDTNGLEYFNPAACKSKTILDDEEYIIYMVHFETYKIDTCREENYTLIDSFLMPSKQLVPHYKSVLNFSTLCIEQPDFNFERDDNISDKKYYRDNIAEEVHRIVNTKNEQAIIDRLNAALAVFNKYKIKHTLVPKTIADYLIQNDFQVRYDLVTNSEYNMIYPDVAANAATEESPLVETAKEKNADAEKYLGYIETEAYRSIYQNYNIALHRDFQSDMFLVFIIMALFFAAFVVLAHSVDAVSGLLSIPAAGVVLLFCGLIAIIIKHETSLIFIFCLLALGFLIYGFKVVKSSSFGRRMTSISLLLGFYSIPFFAVLFFTNIHEFSKSIKINSCEKPYEYYRYHMGPTEVIVLCIILLFLYLPLLKKLKAKADE